MARRSKVSIVGAGNVGATAAHWAAAKELGDIVLVDIVEGVPQGKSLDLSQAGPIEDFDSRIVGSNGYAETEGSDVVIVTAGVPRKPGMSRDDLLAINKKIVGDVAQNIAKYAPNAFVIVVSNPLDAMCHVMHHFTKFPRERVVGMAGILDTARYKTFIGRELDVSVEDISAMVLGGHGDTMVPLPRHTSIQGVPLTELLPKDKIDAIVKRTANGGAEIVGLLKTGSAYYAPAAACVQMAEAVIRDKKRVVPAAALCQGEYGYSGLFIGVPVVLGAGGMERILKLDLNAEEKAMLDHSANAVKGLVEALKLE
ncbi:MAG: malate dehydrogenase [Deltaproteobacteria bacterium]|nr:malate dehydrogenase [Deltaproteobacteria bacterium]